MQTNKTPDRALLDEYGLNEVTYRLLVKVAAHPEPLPWRLVKMTAGHERVTGNPAPALRKLVDRNLLSGPRRGEDIRNESFAATQAGFDLVARIARGLHRPEWLSQSRLRALRYLSSGVACDTDILRPRGIRLPTLQALERAGYVQGPTVWRITDLGREAWAEWQAQQEAK
jgi:hypothetical protein